jgi:hypothetical protein
MDEHAPPVFRKVSLGEEAPVMTAGGTLQWIPLRRRLGIRAFGTNAFRAARAGDRVIEDHVESPGQEELYVVITGRARFDLDGEIEEAAAGDVVFVPNPEIRRGAVGLEDNTLVLAVGGWPGQAYHSLPWEPIYMAREAMRLGRWSEAAEILEREAGEHIDRPIVRFRLACCHAQGGNHDLAVEELQRAIEADEGYRERATEEELLEPLHNHPGWVGKR